MNNTPSNKIRIAMAWWWTWWHVFPIQSMIEYIISHNKHKSQIDHIYRFGKKNSLEHKVFHQIQNISISMSFIRILSWKYRRETLFISRLKNIRDIFLFIIWVFQSLFYLIYFRINVIFCKWWFVALPLVVAWYILRKKIIVHESDTHPGLVNKIASKFASKVFTWFDNVLAHSHTVGQIISDKIIFDWDISQITNPILKQIFSNPLSDKVYVFITGWSQGSYRLYKSFIDNMSSHPKTMSKFIFIVSLWILNNELKQQFSQYSNIYTFDFLSQQEMWVVYYYSDIALMRAGTTSLAEAKLYDLKLFMVPISWTHDQYDNAKYYVKNHQDLLLDQKNPNFDKLLIQAFQQNAWFHKTLSNKNLWQLINNAKEQITKSIVN